MEDTIKRLKTAHERVEKLRSEIALMKIQLQLESNALWDTQIEINEALERFERYYMDGPD